jgi:hypothetical protein
MGTVEEDPRIKRWVEKVKENGGCIQCQHPWYDGLCTCPGGNGCGWVKLHRKDEAKIRVLGIKLEMEKK